MSEIMPNSSYIFEEQQAFYSQLGFYLNNSSNLNNNNNNNSSTLSPIVNNLNDQSNQKPINNNNNNNIPSSFALDHSLISSTTTQSHDVIIPPICPLQRSTSNLWACEEDKESHGRKRSNGEDILGISMKKKIKTRKKVREPRFCFKTMSDIDVLDDGYKWRKYGQKVVKNTLHPRSYYRCTQDKCRVKKRVERLAEDPRMVITTYEGRHVHSPSQDLDDSQAARPLLNNFFW